MRKHHLWSFHSHTFMETLEKSRTLVVATYKHALRLTGFYQASGVSQSPLHRVLAIAVCDVISVTFGTYRYTTANGIVGALHKECWTQCTFPILYHLDKEFLACLEHAVAGRRYYGIRNLYVGFLQRFERRKH